MQKKGVFLKKRKGVALLVSAVLSSIVMMLVAMGLATVNSSQFHTMDAARTSLQTLQLAEVKASELRVTSYSTIGSKAQTRATIPSTTFEREVVIGPETDLGGGSKQTIATVNIYKPGESQPRFALPVPLSSQGSGNLPPGTILPWWGNLTSIPSGFVLCDGANGTPDLRGRTLIGSGYWNDAYGTTIYNLGNSGGERKHQLTIDEMPAHQHKDAMGEGWTSIGTFGVAWEDGNRNPGANVGSLDYDNYHFYTSKTGGDQPHNIMQPFMVVHWIMKL